MVNNKNIVALLSHDEPEQIVIPRKMTINQKLIDKIDRMVSQVSSIGNIKEFQEYESEYELFENRPERWTPLEEAIYEHTERVRSEIMAGIKEILTKGNSR